MLSKYPRPQLKRDSFLSLNGSWLLNGKPIQVPYPPQSELSGYRGAVPSLLEYRREFTLPSEIEESIVHGGRLLLHFGAVDQVARVTVDGSLVGEHEGGYLPFCFDVTESLRAVEDSTSGDEITPAMAIALQSQLSGGAGSSTLAGGAKAGASGGVSGGAVNTSTTTGAAGSGTVHQLAVEVTDKLGNYYPYGKQTKKSHGMWYTAVSGIWQTVWMECVPRVYISELKLTPHVAAVSRPDGGTGWEQSLEVKVGVEAGLAPTDGLKLELAIPTPAATAKADSAPQGAAAKAAPASPTSPKVIVRRFDIGDEVSITFDAADGFKNWSPEHPHLYAFRLVLRKADGTALDTVTSYFALRTVSIDTGGTSTSAGAARADTACIDDMPAPRVEAACPRILLNGEPLFLNAVLDQGYFPGGIFTPETEAVYEADIRNMKRLGFNALRKHIKVEMDYFYYLCDRLGMIVMQDFVQNGSYQYVRDTVFPGLWERFRGGNPKLTGDPATPRDDFTGAQGFFIRHSLETIEHLYNHPCVVYWTVFNEGWGQFSANDLYRIVKAADPTRIVDTTSGWFKGAASDVESDHLYFKPRTLDDRLAKSRAAGKPLIVSECGGYSLRVPGHDSTKKKSYGYGDCTDGADLTAKIKELYAIMVEPYKNAGLSGVVYTQLSDVENETNGLYTFDRAVCKVNSSLV